jgi:hypothetical protein
MLAVSRGQLILLSTPLGQRGFFYEAWISSTPWERFRITADQVARITPQFLAEEKQALGERWYRQEYECSFEAGCDSVFDPTAIDRAFAHDFKSSMGDVQV